MLLKNEGVHMQLMQNKKGIIFGVANNKSIAWGIAEELKKAGAELAFTYLNAATESRVRELANSVDSPIVLPCDVSNEMDLLDLFEEIKIKWGRIDFLVHSIAYAEKDDLRGDFSQVSRDGFLKAMDVSVYSLIKIVKFAKPYLIPNSSIITMTYLGATRSVPSYGIMGVAKAGLEASVRYLADELGPQGIRVNAISAGAVRTLASSAIANFSNKLRVAEEYAPMRRTVTQQEVGKSALYLLSDLASGVTGEVHFVDAGFNFAVAAK